MATVTPQNKKKGKYNKLQLEIIFLNLKGTSDGRLSLKLYDEPIFEKPKNYMRFSMLRPPMLHPV